ncbi:unnamed protein product [Acanthoscelides obtectus]|uniref:C2H2-type domain-containing protein n=1 Tax=Acanthoscelides obtectus TaxID=200917 RepID=A0A9P0KWI2_ACAOB|nr:unnamed protein product [Acanthoscelides obtectus]CAK1676253.1 Zinc finger protein 26 [Acanthoscelides obtectus]
MEPKTDDKPCRKSEDYDSMQKNEHWIGVNQVKMKNQLVVEVKSEKPDTEPTVDDLKIENMDTMILNEQLNIKSEYNEDPVCHLIWDRVKEEKIESGIEPDSTADSVEQRKLGFQESEKMEEKPDLSSTDFENMDAVGLHEEFDIKTESDQSDDHNSPTDSAQIKKNRKKELGNSPIEEGKKSFSRHICNYTSHCEKGLICHIKRDNCYLGSSLGKSRSVSKKQYQYCCIKCNEVFKSKTSLNKHLVNNHVRYIESVSSKIHECTFCDFKTAYKKHLPSHMLRHTIKLFVCKHCNTSFKSTQSLFDHILRIHPNFIGSISNKIYECMHCAHKGIRRSNFIRHMAKHNNQTTFKCINCDASFNTKLRLENHISQKHPKFGASESNKILECTNCEYKTAYKEHLVRHMLKHTGAKCTCTKCDASFTEKRSLDNHILQKHPELSASVSHKIHECTHCEYKTTDRKSLAGHIMKHTGAKLTCTKCEASFTSQQSLDNHILRKHQKHTASVSTKIHECTHCEYKTTHTHAFASHMMKHTGTKRTCSKCNASFINKILLYNHILRKHPELSASVSHKIHQCTHCEYKTTKARYLARHIMKHTGAKLTCTNCDASFTSQQSLDNHILREHQKFAASVFRKIHECTHCEYKTTYLRELATHMMKHTGAKLTCTKCDASFIKKISLYNHILQKHPELSASVPDKIHECIHCEYKTTYASSLSRHMMKHTGAKFLCTKCDVSFITKHSLDNHILQKHPECTTSVSRKIHKCTYCEYKSLQKSQFIIHMMKHTGARLTCTMCDASSTNKQSLDNHILKKHPELIASVTSKIHECIHCEYKTTLGMHFRIHMMKHTGAKRNCTKCDASFTTKLSLDNHIVQKHPQLAASVSSKIHKCTHCEYKTTLKKNLTKHMMKCDSSFPRKEYIDNHTSEKHPQLTASVNKLKKSLDRFNTSSCDIYECCNVTFDCKSTFDDHVIKNHADIMR